jgi:hypothetical protein
MDVATDKMVVSSDQEMKDTLDPPPKQEETKTKKKTRATKSTQQDKSVPTQDWSDPDNSPVGCFGLLKQISCTLHCGGTTCSVKETSPDGIGSSSPTETEASVESLMAVKSRDKKRKRTIKTAAARSSASSERPPKKRARTSCVKKSPSPKNDHVHSTH